MTEETTADDVEQIMVDLKLRADADTLKRLHEHTQSIDGFNDEPEQVLQVMMDYTVALVMAARLVGVEDYSKVMEAASKHGERMAVIAEGSISK